MKKNKILFNMEKKKALKEYPRLYQHHQIFMSSPKVFSLSAKYDFKKHKKTLLKRHNKDIVLEGGWIMR